MPAPEPSVPEEQVILVDITDREIGRMDKLEAHRRGALHRAVSVFVFDAQGRVLLQQRAAGKYHSPGRWSNTCCSHPRPGETVAEAARRRLREEMGIDCELRPAGVFRYRADLERGLVEHEIDHVFVGRYDRDPAPDPAEVGAWRWIAPVDLRRELARAPAEYSAWLLQALDAAERPTS